MKKFKQLIFVFVILFHFNSQATFSIAAIDTITGEVGVAGASCIGGSDIIGGIIPGVGCMNAQASVCIPNYNLEQALFDMEAGLSAFNIVGNRIGNDACSFGTFVDRQYVVTTFQSNDDGTRSAAFTGNNTLEFSGHRKGSNYALGGNILLDVSIIEQMEEAFVNSTGKLSDRLMAVMQAAKVPGADSRCLDEGVSTLSSFIKVAKADDDPNDFFLDIVVPSTPYGVEPIDVLQEEYDVWYETAYPPETCAIDFCNDPPIFQSDDPIFDSADGSIILNNILIGNVGCNAEEYNIGIAIYIYQLLPNGERIYQCSVTNQPPDNIVGNIPVNFGQISICGADVANIGNIMTNADNGFSYCDGAKYEIEGVIFSTELMDIDFTNLTVYGQLPDDQYQTVSFGTIDVNVNGEFPGDGQPLTTAQIVNADTGDAGSITVNCGENVTVYVEGLSRLSNCQPFDDINTGIASELSNELSMVIDDGDPILVQSADNAFGGQLTGPNTDGICYGGIRGNYVLDYESIDGLCEGSTITLTLKTTDQFTNNTAESNYIVTYSGAACEACEPMDTMPVGLNNIDESIAFSVYPNPAKDVVQIDLAIDNISLYNVQLVNIEGKVITVLDAISAKQQLNLSNLKLVSGLYYLNLVDENFRVKSTVPLIVNP